MFNANEIKAFKYRIGLHYNSAIKNMLVILMPTIRNATVHLIVFLVILSSIIENVGADNCAI